VLWGWRIQKGNWSAKRISAQPATKPAELRMPLYKSLGENRGQSNTRAKKSRNPLASLPKMVYYGKTGKIKEADA